MRRTATPLERRLLSLAEIPRRLDADIDRLVDALDVARPDATDTYRLLFDAATRAAVYGAFEQRQEIGRQGHVITVSDIDRVVTPDAIRPRLVPLLNTLTHRLTVHANDGASVARSIVNTGFAVGRALERQTYSLAKKKKQKPDPDEFFPSTILYSATLDANTCAECEAADGQEFDVDSDLATIFAVPYSQCESVASGVNKCRCIWVAVEDNADLHDLLVEHRALIQASKSQNQSKNASKNRKEPSMSVPSSADREVQDLRAKVRATRAKADAAIGTFVRLDLGPHAQPVPPRLDLIDAGQAVSLDDNDLRTSVLPQAGVSYTIESTVGEGADSFVSLIDPDGQRVFGWFRADQLQPANAKPASITAPAPIAASTDAATVEFMQLAERYQREHKLSFANAVVVASQEHPDAAERWLGHPALCQTRTSVTPDARHDLSDQLIAHAKQRQGEEPGLSFSAALRQVQHQHRDLAQRSR